LPLTTPFETDFSVATAALTGNIEKFNLTGISGYVVLGSTGERVHLNEREYGHVVEVARKATDLSFIVGAGQQSTMGTIDEVKKAAELGADAVLVITPNYYRSAITQEVLVGFYTAVADASTVPVLLYSMPALTGIKIEPHTVAQLSEHPNIVGVKDSSNDIERFAETRKLCPEDFAVLTGNGTVFLDALKAGATGAILAVGCVAPEFCLEIFRRYRNGEVCDELQSKLTPLAAAVTTRFGIGGLKAALDLVGYSGGEVRAPLSTPGAEAREEIKNLLAATQERTEALSA
jgi:4-hydroxy-2-oxoglutarate aldolase